MWTIVDPEGTAHDIADEAALLAFAHAQGLRSNNLRYHLGGATAVVGAPAGAARGGCHRDRPTRARRSLRHPRRAEHPRVASRLIGEQRKLLASPLGSAAAPAAFSDLKPTLSADRSI